MLTQKLNVDDLQFEKGTFDGTMAYAQNKVKYTVLPQLCSTELNWQVCWTVFMFLMWQRQQVILTERWASQHKDIHFSSMHPGWADTPGKRKERITDMLIVCCVSCRSSSFSLYLLYTTETPDLQLLFFCLSVAVKTSMPSFHAKMQSRLRTEAMGADTTVWLAVSPAATKQPSGLFFQG